ncbi:MAG: mechanosensitive ion channel [Bryobacteraceae bacterium]|nr:mechanosensitive ion channel [Bryobacteraceae bacterium]
MQRWAIRFGTSVVIFIGFWIGARILQAVISRVHTRVPPGNADLLDLLGRVAGLALMVFGAITALGTLGIDVSALVAGLGLTGFALGFAFRDVLSNLLAGILILLYRPFSRGDHIAVTGFDGIVSQIDLRYTTLQSEGKIILIPNSNLFTNPIEVRRSGPPAA